MSELWTPGAEIYRSTRTMTAERMRWYADALHTVVLTSDVPIVAEPNIHTDDDLARANGLPARVADGMVSTNWISSALTEVFGDQYLHGSSLRTRYARPIFEDERIEVVVRVAERQPGEGESVDLEVECKKADGTVATGGTATVRANGT